MTTESPQHDSDHAESGPPDAKPFLAHLEDLRWTLVRCILTLGIALVAVIPFLKSILGWLQAPLQGAVPNPDNFLRSLQVHGAFAVLMQVAVCSALIVSAPIMFFFVAQFVMPALTRAEKRMVYRCVGPACALFLLGVLMGYYVTLPIALRVMFGMHEFINVAAEWTINNYISFTTNLLLGFGIAFELPMVVLGLGYLGIVSAEGLRERRPYVVILLLVLAMLLTPPDWITQLMMAVPLYAMYEISILVIAMHERRIDG